MKKIMILFLVISLFFLTSCSKPACVNDEECGTTQYSENYCDDNIVKKDLLSYSCINPSTKGASCWESKEPEQVKECNSPYKCDSGDCMQQNCYELSDTTWLGGPTSSRIFFETPKARNELVIMAMKTGAEFKVHLYTDKNELPDRKIYSWGPLNDDDIDDYDWIKLNMKDVETMPSAYYWIGIEVIEYGEMAFNTCVTNDREDDTFGRENTIINGEFGDFEDSLRTEHDIVYLFE